MPRKSSEGADAPSPKPRRAKGTGTLRRRADGRWEVRLPLTDPDGHRHTYSEYLPKTATEADAAARLAALLAAQRAGQLVTEHPTVNAVLDAWLASLQRRVTPPEGSSRAPSLTRGTLGFYTSYAATYLRPRIGAVPVADLKPLQVQALLDYWDGQGYRPKTVAHIRGVLRAALHYAMRREWVLRNVADGRLFDLPRIARPAIQPFTAPEARQLLLTAAGTRDAALWTVLLAFGLRLSEALGLTWDAWDEAGRQLHIRRQLARFDGAFSLAALKTPQSRRTLPVPPAVALALRGQRTQQAQERTAVEAAGGTWPAAIPDLIFTTRAGQPLTRPAVWGRFQRLCRKADLPPRSVHSCRHSAAALLRDQGVPLDRIKEFLGHSAIQTTIDIYGHATVQGQTQAVEVLARALWETG